MKKKLLSILLALVMLLSALPGMGVTAIADGAKTIQAGESYYIGDTIAFSEPYPWVRYDDDVLADYVGQLKARENTTVPTPTYDGRCLQWKFSDVWTYDFNGWTSYTLRITGSADVTPLGFKCSGGTGTSTDPYTFECIYPAVAEGSPYADLVPTGDEDADDLTAKQVTFNGRKWYVIQDDSTAENAGTLTLLYAGTLGNTKFDENGSNVYASSSIKAALGNMTAESGSYYSVAEAIRDTENGKLYLLSDTEAEAVPQNVRTDFPSQAWWLRTARGDGTVAYVYAADQGRIPDKGVVPTTAVVDVRPALQLDLSKVVYNAANQAFYIPNPATAPTDVTVTGATLIAGYGEGRVSVTATEAAGHTLSYQWYQNTTNSNEGGEKIEGATTATYDIPTGNAAGEYYYYCVVTATRNDNSLTASINSDVAVVTVAADTDALVAKLAEEKGIDLSQYYLIPATDMYFTSGQHWIRGNVDGRNVNDNDDYRVATKQFTIDKLPEGSLIFCKAYYAFEAVAWNEKTYSVNNELVGRRNHILTKVGDQFSWWNDYPLFGFNLTKYAEGDFNTKEEADLQTISNAFRIYVPKGEAVAKIDDVSYYTLADAVRASKSGDTIKLLRNAQDNLVVTSGKGIKLDLNGYTLTNDGKHSTIITQKEAKLEVIDTSEAKSGTVDNITHRCAPLFNNGGTVTLNGGTFIRSQEAGNGKNSYYTVVNRGTMTINEGVVIGDGKVKDSSLIDNGYSEINRSGYREIDPNIAYGYVAGESAEKPTLTVNGGTFKGGRHTLNNDVNGIATVNGGDFSTSTGNAVYNVGELTISGGTFKAEAEGKFVLYNAAESGEEYGPESASGTVTVTGGTFIGKLQKDEGTTTEIKGGEFYSFLGGSLRRRVLIGTNTVVNDETDIRFGYTFTLPEGAVIDAEKSKFEFGTTEALGRSIPMAKYVQNGDGSYTSNLVVVQVKDSQFETPIYSKLTVVYKVNGEEYTLTSDSPQMRTVKQVCEGLKDSEDAVWSLYAQSLLDKINENNMD